MPSSLFGNSAKPNQTKPSKAAGMIGMVGKLSQIVGMLQRSTPEEAAEKLAQMNPAFAEFRKKYANASIEQIAQENGFDVDGVKAILQALHLI